jgi:signal transduction histidine kinase
MYVAIEFKFYYRNLMKAQALRNKIAIDLHDDLGTKLSTVRMFLKSLKGNQTIQTKNDTVLLDNSLSLLDTSIDDLRQVMNELKALSLLNRVICSTEKLITVLTSFSK